MINAVDDLKVCITPGLFGGILTIKIYNNESEPIENCVSI